MTTYTIYHNPRCSKSRQTLAMLNERGTEPEIVEYLKSPLSVGELQSLQQKLGAPALAMIRSQEKAFNDLGLNNGRPSDRLLLEAIAMHPVLLARPIVVCADSAVIGRPPENVLELL